MASQRLARPRQPAADTLKIQPNVDPLLPLSTRLDSDNRVAPAVESEQQPAQWQQALDSAWSRDRGVFQPLVLIPSAQLGGQTPLARAQASFSSGVKQQQWVQHCSAFKQPQWWFWQG
jgi:hypothetical protein